MQNPSKDLEPSQNSKAPEGLEWIKFHTQNPQTCDATLHKLVTTVIWHAGFVHPCACTLLEVLQFLIL